jgi:amino-acid N-acetyltransferase
MMAELHLQPATQHDRPWIQQQLQANNLPDADLLDILSVLKLAYHEAQRVGMGGIELYPPYGLLRSLVVAAPYRGKGYGKAFCNLLIAQAQEARVQELYLLTTTADSFFANLGFVNVERNSAPTAIQNTCEFSHLCPAIAVCMRIVISAKVDTYDIV